MLGLHHRIFDDQPANQETGSLSKPQGQSYNKRVLKILMRTSTLSCIMMIVIVVIFLVCQITDIFHGKFNLSVISGTTLLKYGANSNILVNEGQVWRIFTAMFLHAGALHLFANASSFFMYLMPVQSKIRSRVLYASVLIVGGMLGNILSGNFYNIKEKSLLAVGSSTSICSVIGFDFAYRILRVNGQPLQARRLAITFFYLLLISIMPGVDFFGHFGSFFGGILIGFSFLKANDQYYSNKKGKLIRIASIIGLSTYIITNLTLLIKWQQ